MTAAGAEPTFQTTDALPTHRTDSVPPLTSASTVREWWEHSVGGPLLRAALGGVDKDTLAPAFGLTLGQAVGYSGGALPATLLDVLLAQLAVAER